MGHATTLLGLSPCHFQTHTPEVSISSASLGKVLRGSARSSPHEPPAGRKEGGFFKNKNLNHLFWFDISTNKITGLRTSETEQFDVDEHSRGDSVIAIENGAPNILHRQQAAALHLCLHRGHSHPYLADIAHPLIVHTWRSSRVLLTLPEARCGLVSTSQPPRLMTLGLPILCRLPAIDAMDKYGTTSATPKKGIACLLAHDHFRFLGQGERS